MIRRLVDFRPGEGERTLLSFVFLYVLMTGYYILKPVRDALGLELGTQKLPWLFMATMVVVYLANLAYGSLVSRWDRRRFISTVYRFFAVNLLLFAALFRLDGASGFKSAVIITYFQWVSVFNIFVVAIFWSFMNDVWTTEEGKRLYGPIAAGGMAGALSGGAITSLLVRFFRPEDLLLLSAVALELCVQAMFRIHAASPAREPVVWASGSRGGALGSKIPVRPNADSVADESPRPEGEPAERAAARPEERPASDGLRLVLGSRYLTLLAFFMLLITVSNTFQYFQLNTLIEAEVKGKKERTAYFAGQNTAVNLVSLAVVPAVAPILTRFGVTVGLLLVPIVMSVGSALFLGWPTLFVAGTTYVLASGLHYSVNRASREVLYTPTAPHEKYTAKSFIDTFVYRAGDAGGAAMVAAVQSASAAPAMLLAGLVLLASLGRIAVIVPLGRRFAAVSGTR